MFARYVLLHRGGDLPHHLSVRVRLVRGPRRSHEQSTVALSHSSLDRPLADGAGSLLD